MTGFYPPDVIHRDGVAIGPNVVIVCEHAAPTIPPAFSDLGLPRAALLSHIAWDPGAVGVAREMGRLLDGDLVAGSVSRLLYDCNRPPDVSSAMPEVSEIVQVPGNTGLSAEERAARVAAIYRPFHRALSDVLDTRRSGVLLTVHSFTPVFHGVRRACEIGLLHDDDARLADAMLAAVTADFPFKVERNVPYSAEDGVTHTLKEHGIARGWPNVMIEIRNDLIASPDQQAEMARRLAALFTAAHPRLKASDHV